MYSLSMKKGLSYLLILTLVMGLFATFSFTRIEKAFALSNGAGLTPIMGWSSWNTFHYNISEALIKQVVDAMDTNGMRAAGYQYINIDAGWWDNNLGPTGNGRDASGNIISNAARFPSGMKAIADYIHSKGFKAGIYTDMGPTGCGVAHGSYGHYQQDAQQFAIWGFDLIKLDACGGAQGVPNSQRYTEFRDAILSTGRQMVFSICEWGNEKPWEWGTDVGNYWRVGGDIDLHGPLWTGVNTEINISKNIGNYAGQGHWNDMDMMVVGVTSNVDGSVLSDVEAKAHFSMWAELASPMIAGNDVRNMPANVSNILLNSEVIAVNQDSLGKQGMLVEEASSGLQVFSKTLQGNGLRAVVLFNKTDAAANITVHANALGLQSSFTARDLWSHTDLGAKSVSYTANVPSHGAVMLKIQGTEVTNLLTANPGFDSSAPTQTPTGWLESGSNVDASYTETFGGAHNGVNHATHYKTTAYQVYTSQVKTGLANGSYNLTAWVKSSGGQTVAQMQAKNYGGAQINTNIPASTSWKQVSIKNIPVTNGQLELGFSSTANAHEWIYFDEVTLTQNSAVVIPGNYKLINKNSDKLLDIAYGSMSDLAQAIQWTDNGGNNQLWNIVMVGNYYKLVNLRSGKNLDVLYGSMANQAQVGQYSDNGQYNQQWSIVSVGGGVYKLLNRNSGKALDVENNSTADGGAVVQWPDSGAANQQWTLLSIN